MRSRAVLVLALSLLWAPHRAAAQADREAPRRLGFVEETGVTLLLIDVEAVDEHGRPLTGLTLSDFSISLGLRAWKLYSVDDLCPCAAGRLDGQPGARPAPAGAALPDGASDSAAGLPDRAAADPSPMGLPPRAEPVTFVLYLDFAQLRMDGRGRAVRNAERWIRETLRPGESAMVVAYASGTGLRRLCPPTSDKARLLKTLGEAYEDHAFIDTFPEELLTRAGECAGQPALCPIVALQEYFHGRSTLRALMRLLTAVEEIPGRKAVLYFHENGMMSPGAFYRTDVPDHLDLAKDLGAAANQAHASIYTVNVGGPGDQALTLGLNLSDFTGGRHNRGGVDAARFLDETERSCRCLYRLGLVPPERPDTRTHAAVIRAAGHVLPHRYEVRFLSDADRWMRGARLVLEDPAKATEISLASALLPLRAGKRRWDVSVRIALETSSLTLLPRSGGLGGEWETGALFHRDDGSEVHEMLGVYHVQQAGKAGGTVVHEHELNDLEPGTYRMRAFVRDRAAGLFGGTETVVTLPHPRRGGMTEPVWMYGSRDQLRAPLPLATGHDSPAPGAITRWVGPVPAGDDPLAGGAILEAHTWFCRGEEPGVSPGLRFITRDARPLLRFDEPHPEPAGSCFLLVDRLDSASLPPGSYVYRLSTREAPGEATLAAPFRVQTLPH